MLSFKSCKGKAVIGFQEDRPGISFLGIDSEGTGKEEHNLLREPVSLSWSEGTCRMISHKKEVSESMCRYIMETEGGQLHWTVTSDGSSFIFEIRHLGWRPLYGMQFSFNLSQKNCPTAVLPGDVDGMNRMLPPWLLIAPDHGHLYLELLETTTGWSSLLTGNRSDRRLLWSFFCEGAFNKGDRTVLRVSMPEIAVPEGVDKLLWEKMRRPWLNLFQANAHENDVETPMMLANNVLSNPAVCCTFLYSDPMLFNPYPLPGINMPLLVRRTIDDWFKNRVMQHGNVSAFGKSDTYLFTNPAFICAARDYVKMTSDMDWLGSNLKGLCHVADFILRRDVDMDGLTESIHSGNAWSLRDPDRSDFYLETINFGHKNAFTNAFAYRALSYMKEMLDLAGKEELGNVYASAAEKLKDAYFRTFYNPETGVIAGWISQDGKVHDYIFPFVNGIACAYGLVPKTEGRKIMGIIMERLRGLKPEGWRWGIPVNLIPVPDYDLIQPNISSTGMEKNTFSVLKTTCDDIGLKRWVDPDGSLSFKGKALYNGAVQSMLTAHMIMGLDSLGMDEERRWLFEPMLDAAVNGEFQNGLHVAAGGGAEHHDWDGNPTGYEGYLPEGWYFLLSVLLRDEKNHKKLFPFLK